MRVLERTTCRGILGVLVLVLATSANALTAQEIADSLIDNLDNVSDYEADIDADLDDIGLNDMADGTLQYKRIGVGTCKMKKVFGSPFSGSFTSDGNGWNIVDRNDDLYYATQSNGEDAIRYSLFSLEEILDTETWTKASGTETINSVSCYRIYTTKANSNYEIWADAATACKVIRMRVTDDADDLLEQVDYGDYSHVESTAYLPGTIEEKHYEDEQLEYTVEVSTSNVDINAGLADSVFAIETP